MMTDDDLRALWRKAGGDFHGPRVETGTMPESKLLPFLRELLAAERERCAGKVQALVDSHCAGTGGECAPSDNSCDFVAAWSDAIAAIREA